MSSDLISREALNETIDKITWYHINTHGELAEGAYDDGDAFYKAEDIYNAIDNAPTVEPCLSLDNISDEDIKKFKLIWQRARNKGIRLINERPQGEWICITKSTFPQYQPDEYKCSECSGPSSIEYYFCPHCGADMRGNNK